MAPVLDASTPARVGPSVLSAITSASFNAPADSIIIICVSGDSGSSNPVTFAFSNNGTGLSWSTTNIRGSGESSPDNFAGAVGIGIAQVGGSARSGLTVTATMSGHVGSRNLTMRPYVFTAFDASSPLGTSIEGSSASVNTLNINFTTVQDDSVIIYVANESSESGAGAGNPTSSNSTISPYSVSGTMSGASGYLTKAVAGAITIDLDAPATALKGWHWVAIELKNAPVLSKSPPLRNPRARYRHMLVR